MALAADCFAGSSGIDSPVGTVVVTQSCDCLSPCFATGIAGKVFTPSSVQVGSVVIAPSFQE